MRILIAALPWGAVAGWGGVGLVVQRNHGTRSCFSMFFKVETRYPGGLSRAVR